MTTQEELPPLPPHSHIDGENWIKQHRVENYGRLCIAKLKAENEGLRAWVYGLESANGELEYSIRQQESAYKARAEAAQSQAAALQAELTEAKAQWAKWAGLYEHELDNCNKAESQAAAMARLLEDAREWMGEPPIYFQPSAPGSWRARIDAALAAWKGKQ
jgi:hypothetical protein